MRHKKYGLWQEVTWKEYYDRSRELASGLYDLGVRKGDFVGIIGENGPEWVFIDMATQMLGATTVGIYATNAWEQVEYVINHAECKILFAEDEEQVDKWLRFRSDTPQLEKVIYWEDKGLTKMNESELMRFDDLMSTIPLYLYILRVLQVIPKEQCSPIRICFGLLIHSIK
jgi:long-chain acyl-CoA synthetase